MINYDLIIIMLPATLISFTFTISLIHEMLESKRVRREMKEQRKNFPF